MGLYLAEEFMHGSGDTIVFFPPRSLFSGRVQQRPHRVRGRGGNGAARQRQEPGVGPPVRWRPACSCPAAG
ncbi:MAG: hypothetical protein MZU79_01850 [Anaerotruncus sp.]|nr:hypothetical protein [Anaerotruncus sp.]